MQAVILAGGLGTRLRSVVNDRPKTMALVNNKPFLAYQLEFLVEQGVKKVILCVGYLHEQIMEYFQDGRDFGLKIEYSVEQTLLGTGGAIKLAESKIGNQPFYCLNGDTYSRFDLGKLAEVKNKFSAAATIVLSSVPDASRYGTVEVADDGRVLSFMEKNGEAKPALVNVGCYLFSPSILDLIVPNKVVSLEQDVLPKAIKQNIPVYGCKLQGEFIDIGTPESYAYMQKFEGGKK
jgi:D-glycero-alpha-D-manno-heptose 1-phosphate guanylyltransferase